MSDENIMNEGNSEELAGGVKIVEEPGLGYTLTVDKEDLLKAASALKEAGLDLFLFVAGTDYPDTIKLTYRVYSSKRQSKIAVMVKTEVPKSDPVIDSLTSLWPAAGWHEREAYDLLGVVFKGNPDMRRIFMPDDWKGHPLRKDYTDDRMIVMDDGKKDKAAAKDKPAAAPKEKAEASEKKAEPAPKAEEAGAEPKAEGTQVETKHEVPAQAATNAPAQATESVSGSEQVTEASTDGSDSNE